MDALGCARGAWHGERASHAAEGLCRSDPHDENDFGPHLPGKSTDEFDRSRPTLTAGAALNNHQDARCSVLVGQDVLTIVAGVECWCNG